MRHSVLCSLPRSLPDRACGLRALHACPDSAHARSKLTIALPRAWHAESTDSDQIINLRMSDTITIKIAPVSLACCLKVVSGCLRGIDEPYGRHLWVS